MTTSALDDLRTRLGTRRVPKVRCPACGAQQDAATCATECGAASGDGDLAVCVDCGAVSAYDLSVPGGFRRLSAAEEAGSALDLPLQDFLLRARRLAAARGRT